MRQRKRVAAGGVLAEKQACYVRLISQGVGNSEACRLVGINSQDRESVAIRSVGPEFRRGACAVSAGEDHAS